MRPTRCSARLSVVSRAICRDMTTDGDDVLAAPLSVLGLSLRATNTLLNNGLSTIGDLVAKTEVEIWRLHYLGPATLVEIKIKLSALGLALRPGPPVPHLRTTTACRRRARRCRRAGLVQGVPAPLGSRPAAVGRHRTRRRAADPSLSALRGGSRHYADAVKGRTVDQLRTYNRVDKHVLVRIDRPMDPEGLEEQRR